MYIQIDKDIDRYCSNQYAMTLSLLVVFKILETMCPTRDPYNELMATFCFLDSYTSPKYTNCHKPIVVITRRVHVS